MEKNYIMTVALACLVSTNPILSHKTICGKLKGGTQIEKKNRKIFQELKRKLMFLLFPVF
jgi:hypothetical protein